jgi:hypothetical protein
MSISNTPDSPAQKLDDRMSRGGNFWTLFTPGIWKVLHAVLHSIPPQRRVAAPGGGYEKTEVQTHVQGSFRPVVMMGNP